MDTIFLLRDVFKMEKIHTTGFVWKLHYKLLAGICYLVFIFSFFKLYYGEFMICVDSSLTKNDFGTSACLSVLFNMNATIASTNSIGVYPGLGDARFGEMNWFSFYGRAGLYMVIHAFSFQITWYCWNYIWEGRKMEFLTKPFQLPYEDKEKIKFHKNFVIKYLFDTKGSNTIYVLRYLICESFNAAVAFLNFWLINFYLNGRFMDYELVYLESLKTYNSREVEMTLAHIFPHQTKCSAGSFGPGGSVSDYDYICLLPVMTLYRDVYFLLWFLLPIVYFMSLTSLVFNTLPWIIPCARKFQLKLFLYNSDATRKKIYDKTTYGDIFLIGMLSSNVDKIVMADIAEGLAARLN